MSSNENDQAQHNVLSFKNLKLINASIFNIMLPVAFFIFIRYVPQANHLIFGQLEWLDLLVPTVLIFLYTLQAMVIFIRIDPERNSKVEYTVFGKLNRFFFMLPLAIWILVVLFNKIIEIDNELISSIINLIVLFLALMGLFQLYRFFISRRHFRWNNMEQIFYDHNRPFKYFIFILCLLFFLRCLFDFGNGKNWFVYLLGFVLFMWIIIKVDQEWGGKIVRDLQRNIPWKTKGDYQKITLDTIHKRLYRTFGLLISFLIFLLFYHGETRFLNALSILLFFMICLRIVFYLLGQIISAELNVGGRYSFYINIGLKIGALILFALLIINPSSNRHHHNFYYTDKSSPRDSFESVVRNKILTSTDTSKPLYLVSGQGGGSRAGCAFYTTMSLLDSMVGDQVLAMTTISGSSNGAGFYLDEKNTELQNSIRLKGDSISILSRAKQLYHQDYITNSLFRLLYTDYFKSLLPFKKFTQDRNWALMQDEKKYSQEGLTRLDSSARSILDKTWSSVYDAKKEALPMFLPGSFNIDSAMKAISSPVILPKSKIEPFDDILAKRDINVNQSIALSQLFPVICASVKLGDYHYMDGGIYDNLAFETLFDLYSVVKEISDSLKINRKIILLAINNGAYIPTTNRDSTLTDIQLTSAGIAQTLFSAHPLAHKNIGMEKLKGTQDKFIELNVYNQERVEASKSNIINKIISIGDFFEYKPSNDKIVLTRYLHERDIEKIFSYAHREINDKLKPLLK